MSTHQAPTSSLLQLARVASQASSYLVVDHRSCASYELASFSPRPDSASAIAAALFPEPTELPPASYYLSGVNDRQRQVYDEHCAERYEQQHPWSWG